MRYLSREIIVEGVKIVGVILALSIIILFIMTAFIPSWWSAMDKINAACPIWIKVVIIICAIPLNFVAFAMLSMGSKNYGWGYSIENRHYKAEEILIRSPHLIVKDHIVLE